MAANNQTGDFDVMNCTITTNACDNPGWYSTAIMSSTTDLMTIPYDPWKPVMNGIPLTYGIEENIKNKLPEGVEMKNLYDVYMIYGENRKKPVIKRANGVIANDDEDAKIKSGLMKQIDEEWDADYLTFICNEIGEVKVKEKPKEVKNI